jgi:hypothetical protein
MLCWIHCGRQGWGRSAMKWLRLLASLVTAPLVYGLLCLPLLGWWLSNFPQYINDLGGTFEPFLVISIEICQALVLCLSGAIVALVAGEGRWQRLCLIAATLDMLAIGVVVQRQFWDALPVWHHWVFFLLIVTAIPAGGWLLQRIRSKPMAA